MKTTGGDRREGTMNPCWLSRPPASFIRPSCNRRQFRPEICSSLPEDESKKKNRGFDPKRRIGPADMNSADALAKSLSGEPQNTSALHMPRSGPESKDASRLKEL